MLRGKVWLLRGKREEGEEGEKRWGGKWGKGEVRRGKGGGKMRREGGEGEGEEGGGGIK